MKREAGKVEGNPAIDRGLVGGLGHFVSAAFKAGFDKVVDGMIFAERGNIGADSRNE